MPGRRRADGTAQRGPTTGAATPFFERLWRGMTGALGRACCTTCKSILVVRQIRSTRPASQLSPAGSADRGGLCFGSTSMPKTLTEVGSLARSHTQSAIRQLAAIMRHPKVPPIVRVAAANSLLDRGWGKPTLPLAGDRDNPLRVRISEIVRTIVDPNPLALIDAKVVEGDDCRLLPATDTDTDSD